MPEGDLPPQHLLENIADICATLSIPVLVKEVGFGLGVTQARLLRHAGVRAVDVSGSGGTNFAIIEGRRNQSHWWKDRKSTRLNSSHVRISYAVFCLKKKKKEYKK